MQNALLCFRHSIARFILKIICLVAAPKESGLVGVGNRNITLILIVLYAGRAKDRLSRVTISN